MSGDEVRSQVLEVERSRGPLSLGWSWREESGSARNPVTVRSFRKKCAAGVEKMARFSGSVVVVLEVDLVVRMVAAAFVGVVVAAVAVDATAYH